MRDFPPHRDCVIAFVGECVHGQGSRLRGWRPEPRSLPYAVPGLDWLRCTEPRGWRSVGNAEEDGEIGLRFTWDDAIGDLDVNVHTAIVTATGTGAPAINPRVGR